MKALFFTFLTLLLIRGDKAVSQTDQSPDKLKSNTRMVVVDVVVADSKGAPITDLKQEDFSVLEDARQQRIGAFSFQQPGRAVTDDNRAPAPGVVSNRPRFRSTGLNVILVDSLNGEFASHAYAQERLIKFLESGPAVQPTAIYVLEKELRLLHDFSTDTNSLKEALAGYRPQGSERVSTVYMSASPFASKGNYHTDENSVELTLRALDSLARTLAAYPGRKNLIWLSEAFPVNLMIDGVPGASTDPTSLLTLHAASASGSLSPEAAMKEQTHYEAQIAPMLANSPDSVPANAGHTNYMKDIARVSDALMDAHVALYPIDAAGIGSANHIATQQNLRDMADRTGGRAFYNRNDLDAGIRSSIDDGSTYYTLAYYPENKTWDGRFRTISVKTTRPGVTLRYRFGYYAINPETNAKIKKTDLSEDLGQALGPRAPAFTGLLFEARVLPPADRTQKVTVHFAVDPHTMAFDHQTDGLEHASISCAVAVYNEKGSPAKGVKPEIRTMSGALNPEQYRKMMQNYFPCSVAIALPSGKYSLHLGAADMSSHLIGTTTTSVTVP